MGLRTGRCPLALAGHEPREQLPYEMRGSETSDDPTVTGIPPGDSSVHRRGDESGVGLSELNLGGPGGPTPTAPCSPRLLLARVPGSPGLWASPGCALSEAVSLESPRVGTMAPVLCHPQA